MGLGPLNYILFAITVLIIVEAVLEARRKNWLALAISIAFLALVVYINLPAYQHIWGLIMPSPKPATP